MRKTIVGVVIAVLSVAALPGHAEGVRTAGGLLLLGGAGLMLGAFNYGESCPAGYSTHTFQGLPTQCVYISRSGSDVRQASTTIAYQRPKLMYAGVAAVSTGVVLLLLPKRVQKVTRSLDVTIEPKGWKASKTIRW